VSSVPLTSGQRWRAPRQRFLELFGPVGEGWRSTHERFGQLRKRPMVHPGLQAALPRRPVKWRGRISFLLIFSIPVSIPISVGFPLFSFSSRSYDFPCFLRFFPFFFLLASGLFSRATFGFLHLTPLTVSIAKLGAAGYSKRKGPCFCSLLFLGSLWFFLYFSCYSFCKPPIIRGVFPPSFLTGTTLQEKSFSGTPTFFSFFFHVSYHLFASSLGGGDRERGERRKEGKKEKLVCHASWSKNKFTS